MQKKRDIWTRNSQVPNYRRTCVPGGVTFGGVAGQNHVAKGVKLDAALPDAGRQRANERDSHRYSGWPRRKEFEFRLQNPHSFELMHDNHHALTAGVSLLQLLRCERSWTGSSRLTYFSCALPVG